MVRIRYIALDAGGIFPPSVAVPQRSARLVSLPHPLSFHHAWTASQGKLPTVSFLHSKSTSRAERGLC